MEGRLLDVLAILVAFTTIILLLSLIVTGLVQGTLALFRLRSRNLKRGIQAALQVATGRSASAATKAAASVLNAPTLGGFRHSTAVPAGGVLSRLVGPSVSYVTTEQLKDAMKESKVEEGDEESIKKVCKKFEQLDKPMQRRFNNRVRTVTILWAVLVAGYFQISTPVLLQDLSAKPELRAEYLALTETILAEGPEMLDSALSYANVANDALVLLVERHDELAGLIEQASGIDRSEEELIAELELVLGDNPQRAEIISEYKALLTALYNQQLNQAIALARNAYGELGYINVKPWPFGAAFYRSDDGWQMGNLIGVLMTGFLLMMGAPFWFDRLKDLANLRDVLKSTAGTSTTQAQGDASKQQSGDS